MGYVYLASSIAGLLLAVRLMFFGAERRRQRSGALPLRRSEPTLVAFVTGFGFAGYLLTTRAPSLDAWRVAGISAVLAAVLAVVALRLAMAAARIRPEHDPDDPRFALQGRVTTVTASIPAGGMGSIRIDDGAAPQVISARELEGARIDAGTEVCIERIEDGVAWVERWSVVEARL